MPPWGRPPGATDVGKFFDGVGEDVYRFQEINSDDEKNGVSLAHGSHQISSGKQLHNSDDLYFNDMDIRAWERRASALDGASYNPGYDMQEEDEGYYDDAGEAVSRAGYEELLFTRVLDKIRVARAVGNPDVQLSAEELEAYQTRLCGNRAPAVRSEPKPRSTSSPIMDDTASMFSLNTTHQLGQASSTKSKSKKSQQRSSLFSSKPKKEKSSNRNRAASNASSSSQVPPGFVIPGPDGQRIYTPINAYQGSLARDQAHPSQPGSRSVSDNTQAYSSSHVTPPRDVMRDFPGAFPGSFATPASSYRSPSPLQPERSATWYPSHEPAELRTRPSSIQPTNLVPFPIEPYQYHSFSPASSSSQPSPQLQYTRRSSAPPSEASYTSMPRRVPVPCQRASPVSSHFDPAPLQGTYASVSATYSGETQHTAAVDVLPEPVPVQVAKASASGKDGERRRKGGKSKKRG